MGTFLQVFGVIVIMAGLIAALPPVGYTTVVFNWTMFFSTLAAGMLNLGFGHGLNLLTQIRDGLYKSLPKVSVEVQTVSGGVETL